MHFLGVPTLRVYYLILAGLGIWDLSTGKDPITFAQYSWVGYALLGLGLVLIWFPWPKPRIVSGLCGIVMALAMGYVMWIILRWSFAAGARFWFHAGPLKVGGVFAKLLAVLVPSLLLASSIVVILMEARKLPRSQVVR